MDKKKLTRILVIALYTAILLAVSFASGHIGPVKDVKNIEIAGCTISETFTDHIAVALAGTAPSGTVIEADFGGEHYETAVRGHSFILRLKLPAQEKIEVLLKAVREDGTVAAEHTYSGTPGSWVPSDGWDTVAGLDSQLFLKKSLRDPMRTTLMKDGYIAELEERIRERIESIHAELPDTEFIYLLVPSSATIYNERIPAEYALGSGETAYDQMKALLQRAGATVIDPRETLRAHAYGDMPIYYMTDSHWTQYGAFLAYEELFGYISGKYPAAAPRPVSDFGWEAAEYRAGDLAYYLNIPQKKLPELCWTRIMAPDAPQRIKDIQVFTDDESRFYESFGVLSKEIIETEREELPTALIYRDSYSVALYDIVAERFSRTYMRGAFDYGWKPDEILREKPDYVIFIYCEYNFDAITDN